MEAAVSGIGVSTSGIEHNRANQMFMDGCKKLGMHIVDIPQNTRDEGHACGWCPWGCKFVSSFITSSISHYKVINDG